MPGNNKTVSSFNLGLKPKRKPDPLTVWLVDGAEFSAGAHGGGGGGLWIHAHVCPSPAVSWADQDTP